MRDDEEQPKERMPTQEKEPYQIPWLYAVPCFMASLFVCSIIYGVLPRMWGIRDILMTLVPVLMTIYLINELERNSHRNRSRKA